MVAGAVPSVVREEVPDEVPDEVADEAPGLADGERVAKRPAPAVVRGLSSFATAAHAVVEAASTAAPAATVVQRRLPGAVRRLSGLRRDGLLEC
ncbi:hypothetical protein ACFQGX_28305 [Nonomuraea dietziae]|uniref:hypothetical protein n=1 Tax=Nonomuraea dietziae TaxID=65515 RepID=UPI003613C5AF